MTANPLEVNGSFVMRRTVPLSAFNPYKAEPAPGTTSTRKMSRSDGASALAIGAPMCGAWLSVPGLHSPPGNPKWALPPANMKMVFQGRTAHDLAIQIMDYKRNGHKDNAQLLEHARDTLVKAGWNMVKGASHHR